MKCKVVLYFEIDCGARLEGLNVIAKQYMLQSQGVKILFNAILSYFFGKILFHPIFWEMSYFILFF